MQNLLNFILSFYDRLHIDIGLDILQCFSFSFVTLYGRKGAKHKKPRQSVLSNIELNQEQKDIVIGSMLGDGYMERIKQTHNPRLKFDQTFPQHAAYLTRIFFFFRNITNIKRPSISTRKEDKRTGKKYTTIRFATRNLPCLIPFYDLFYVNGIKTIPINIAEYLTPRAFAYWIMDDGGKGTNGELILHTRRFSLNEVLLLQEAIKKKTFK